MVKYSSFITVLLWICCKANAQQLAPQALNSGGSSRQAGTVVLEDALGGLLVQTVTTPSFMYTQDFLQPDAGTTNVLPVINNVTLSSGSGTDNAGNSYISGNAMLEFTVGEFASNTLQQPGNLLTQGILQPYIPATTLPVTGLEFYAKRISSNMVQLDWKTIQEINNRGFYIERATESNNTFRPVAFVNTRAGSGGNSSLPLEYRFADTNNFSGTSYYRLKQEDMDGRSTYSVIRPVNGSNTRQVMLQVWPVPASGYVNVQVSGLSTTEKMRVMDMNGRLVKEITVQNNTPLQISGLPAGTYYLKLADEKNIGQKILIQ